MKKLFFTLLFAFGFMLVGFASQNQKKQGHIAQKEKGSIDESTKKYDFSLFKFVEPKKEKQDSTKNNNKILKGKEEKDETTYLFRANPDFELKG